MSFEQIDCIRYIEINGTVCTVLTSAVTMTVGANRTVVTGVSAKRIRVIGWIANSTNATAGSWGLRSASGGTVIMYGVPFPGLGGGFPDRQPMYKTGYMETNTGEGLFADVATADMNLCLFYVVYTP